METVQIAEFGSVHEARIAQGLLHAHGIDALARIEDAGGNYPQLAAQVRGGTGVHVPLEQVPDARRLLQRHTRATDGLLASSSDDMPDDVPDDEPDDEPPGALTTRGRRAGLVIVFAVFVLPLVLNVVGALRLW